MLGNGTGVLIVMNKSCLWWQRVADSQTLAMYVGGDFSKKRSELVFLPGKEAALPLPDDC